MPSFSREAFDAAGMQGARVAGGSPTSPGFASAKCNLSATLHHAFLYRLRYPAFAS